MKVKTHAITGFGVGSLLFPVWLIVEKISLLRASVKSIFFLLGTVGEDFDHYINFIFRTWRRRSGSLIEYFKYVIRTAPVYCEVQIDRLPWGKDFLDMFPFHTVEFWLSIYGLKRLADIYIGSSLVSDILMGIFWGVAFHLVLDIVWHIKKKALFRKSWFLVEYPIRRWLMRRKGIDPDKIFREILDSLDKSSV